MLADPAAGEAFLLALLNSTPVVDGTPTDDLADPAAARAWLTAAGGQGTEAELQFVKQARQDLQAVARGQQPPAVLNTALRGVVSRPAITGDRVEWTLDVPAERALAVRAVLAWDALQQRSPG